LRSNLPDMNKMKMLALGVTACLCQVCSTGFGQNDVPDSTYTREGKLKLPKDYRDWIYLSSGFDMSYRPSTEAGHHMFDNVFVNPGAYRQFRKTGTWPDKTVLVLEVRGAQGRGSINQSGNYQDDEVMGLEAHVKDVGRFPGQWAFFAFEGEQPGKMIPRSAECYSCHAAHAAVDTTFVQFYPTLLPLARSKGTLSPSYQAEEAARAKLPSPDANPSAH